MRTGDLALIRELVEAITSDTTAPRINQEFNPTDPVAIEIMLHEADFAVEGYMEKWRGGFRGRFSDPEVYDGFVREYQMKVRRDLKDIVAAAQRYITEELDSPEDDEDWYEGQE
jgi:hypothetical protein